MCQDKTARIIIKQGSGVPTIPVSADHRNGDWIATDIYEGEQYMDTDTGIVYTRDSAGIQAVGGGGGDVQPKVWSAQVTQTGTSAPVLTELINTLGITASSVRATTGAYYIDGFDSNLTGLFKVEINFNFNDTTKTYTAVNSSSSRLNYATYVSGAYTDGILAGGGFFTITVTKYD